MAEENSNTNSSNKLIFIMFGLILLVVIGMAGFFYMQVAELKALSSANSVSQLDGSQTTASKFSDDEVEAGNDSAEPEEVKSEKPIYIKVGPVIVTSSTPGLYDYVKLDFNLETRSQKVEAYVQDNAPRFKQLVEKEIRQTDFSEGITQELVNSVQIRIKEKVIDLIESADLKSELIDSVFISDIIAE